MTSDAPDTADERSSRASSHGRAEPEARYPVIRAAVEAARIARGSTVPRPAGTARQSDQATQDTSEQSTSGSSDDEASDTIVFKKLHPWLPNWSWIQGTPQTQREQNRSRSAAPTNQTPRQQNRGRTAAPTTPRGRSAGNAASTSRERVLHQTQFAPMSEDTRGGTSVSTEVHRDSHSRNVSVPRQRGRQNARARTRIWQHANTRQI